MNFHLVVGGSGGPQAYRPVLSASCPRALAVGRGTFEEVPKPADAVPPRVLKFPMLTKVEKVHGVIHTASAASAAVGAGLAQIPGADMPVICSLQTAMIVSIAGLHGVSLRHTAAADLLLTFSAAVGGRALSQLLVGWIPGIGNAINASTALAITEGIGWAANAYFAEGKGGGENG